jgi:hypothetical protein
VEGSGRLVEGDGGERRAVIWWRPTERSGAAVVWWRPAVEGKGLFCFLPGAAAVSD